MTEILNFIVIFLLITAIIYGFILNRRISLIHDSKKELANLFKSFDNTILKAQTSVRDLKKVSTDISDNLQKKIDNAAIVTDDLAFLSEKAAEITSIMEKKVIPLKKEIDSKPKKEILEPVYSPEQIKNLKSQGKKTTGKINPLPTPANDGKITPQKTKALEGLLEKISKHNEQNKSEKLKTANGSTSIPAANTKVDKEMVTDVLKALGYGEK